MLGLILSFFSHVNLVFLVIIYILDRSTINITKVSKPIYYLGRISWCVHEYVCVGCNRTVNTRNAHEVCLLQCSSYLEQYNIYTHKVSYLSIYLYF